MSDKKFLFQLEKMIADELKKYENVGWHKQVGDVIYVDIDQICKENIKSLVIFKCDSFVAYNKKLDRKELLKLEQNFKVPVRPSWASDMSEFANKNKLLKDSILKIISQVKNGTYSEETGTKFIIDIVTRNA